MVSVGAYHQVEVRNSEAHVALKFRPMLDEAD